MQAERATSLVSSAAKRRRFSGTETWTYSAVRFLGKGAFGVVFLAKVEETGEFVAIKSVPADTCDREVQILNELDNHPNVMKLRGSFISKWYDSSIRLNLVLEYMSDTLHRIIKHYGWRELGMDMIHIKLYMYQLLRALSFVHGRGIMHRDVKPQNLLVDGRSHCLKVSDFGAACRAAINEPLEAYACSRFYRAPELCLGSKEYSYSIDLWSAGCVFAELFLRYPLFNGEDGIHQFEQIVLVLGTPTPSELRAMNRGYPPHEFWPRMQRVSMEAVLKERGWPAAYDLLDQLLKYNPAQRVLPFRALIHAVFHTLRFEVNESHKCLFNFSSYELLQCAYWESEDKKKLVPQWALGP